MDLKLTGKLAFISGSTAGIGHAIATALAHEGARVIVNGREQASVDQAVARISAGPGGEARGGRAERRGRARDRLTRRARMPAARVPG